MWTNRRRDFGNERERQRLTRPVFGLVDDLEVFPRQAVPPPLQLLLLSPTYSYHNL
ncbi:MAG: hypothetical protein ACKV2Q_18675 [Planctomycetaceae bacterium]